MNLKLLIPAGIISLLIGLVVYLPAPVIAGLVQERVPGLHLAGVSGSAFSGRVQYVGIEDINLENINWELSPGSLLLGRAELTLRMATDTGSVSADVSQSLFGGTRISNLTGSASLAWLGAQAGYRFVPMDGLLRLQNLQAQLSDRRITQASGQVDLNNTNWLLFKPPLLFGNYTAAIEATEQGSGIEILDSNGPLKVEGSAQLLANNSYVVDMRVRQRAGADERLKKLLDQLGRPDAQGWYNLRERGQL